MERGRTVIQPGALAHYNHSLVLLHKSRMLCSVDSNHQPYYACNMGGVCKENHHELHCTPPHAHVVGVGLNAPYAFSLVHLQLLYRF